MADQPESVQLPGVWNESSTPVLVANAFAILGTAEDEFFLTVGQVVAPVTSGPTGEQRREQLEKVGYVPINPIGRYSLTVHRMRELQTLLGSVLERVDTGEGAT